MEKVPSLLAVLSIPPCRVLEPDGENVDSTRFGRRAVVFVEKANRRGCKTIKPKTT